MKIIKEGVDAAVDTTGIKQVRQLAYEATAKDGTTVLVGVPKSGEDMCIDSFQLHLGKKLTGSYGGDINPSYIIPRLLRIKKRLKLKEMISKVYEIEKVNEAIEDMRSGNILRPILKIGH